jgi:hypothetical protein
MRDFFAAAGPCGRGVRHNRPVSLTASPPPALVLGKDLTVFETRFR